MFRGLHVSLPPISTTAAPSGLRRSQTTGAALNEKNLYICCFHPLLSTFFFATICRSCFTYLLLYLLILANIYSNVEPFPLQHLFRIFTLINFCHCSYLRQLFRKFSLLSTFPFQLFAAAVSQPVPPPGLHLWLRLWLEHAQGDNKNMNFTLSMFQSKT